MNYSKAWNNDHKIHSDRAFDKLQDGDIIFIDDSAYVIDDVEYISSTSVDLSSGDNTISISYYHTLKRLDVVLFGPNSILHSYSFREFKL